MCWGVREHYQSCDHLFDRILVEKCEAGDFTEEYGCIIHGFDRFYKIVKAIPDICPSCEQQGLDRLIQKYHPLFEEIKERIGDFTILMQAHTEIQEYVKKILSIHTQVSAKCFAESDAEQNLVELHLCALRGVRDELPVMLANHISVAEASSKLLEETRLELEDLISKYRRELADFYKRHSL